MKIETSWGRWGGARIGRPTIVQIAPGWWRFECGRLAIEVDDQPIEHGSLVRASLVLLAVLIITTGDCCR